MSKLIKELCYKNQTFVAKTKTIQDIISNIKAKKICIYGAGEHTEMMFEFLNFDSKEIICIYDKKNIGEVVGYPVKYPKPENFVEGTAIVVSSYRWQKDICKYLSQWEDELALEIVCLYTEDDACAFYHIPLFPNSKWNRMEKHELETLVNMSTRALSDLQSEDYVMWQTLPKHPSTVKSSKNSNTFEQLGIVVQGAVKREDQFTVETLRYYKDLFPKAVIVLSTWKGELSPNDKMMLEREQIYLVENDTPSELIKDYEYVKQRTYDHIEYQMKSTYYGLLFLKEKGCKYAMKIRSDMRFYDNAKIYSGFQEICSYPSRVEGQRNRLVIMPVAKTYKKYKRENQIPDFFMMGTLTDMLSYWSYPISEFAEAYCRTEPVINERSDVLRPAECCIAARYMKLLNLDCKNDNDFLGLLRDGIVIIDIGYSELYWCKYSTTTVMNQYIVGKHMFLTRSDWEHLQTSPKGI